MEPSPPEKVRLEKNIASRLGTFVSPGWPVNYRKLTQHADKQDKPISDLSRVFKEPKFPGFLNFLRPLSQIERVPQCWVDALKSSRGIYLLTCPRTREQYVGSVTGADGFWVADAIVNKEQLWKRKLQSQDMGLNWN